MKHIKNFNDFLTEHANLKDLEAAIKHHEDGNPYYDKVKLRNIFNQLKSANQQAAREKYGNYL